MESFKIISDYIENKLDKVNELIISFAQNEVELIPTITEYLVHSGGKRIRPIITLMFGKALGADPLKTAKLAAAVEIIHTATLLHDDVIDHSSIRRGSKTVNAIWGNKEAILVGDFLLSQAFCLMVECGSLQALDLLAKSALKITESEIWQLELLYHPELAIEKYIKLVEGKTAALFSAASGTIAKLLNKDEQLANDIIEFGKYVGIAFQIADDILDYTSNHSILGKDSNHDLLEGKITLPLILALPNLSKADQDFIIEEIRKMEQGIKINVNTIYKLIIDNNGVALARGYLDSVNRKAHAKLDKLATILPRDIFVELINMNINRLY